MKGGETHWGTDSENPQAKITSVGVGDFTQVNTPIISMGTEIVLNNESSAIAL